MSALEEALAAIAKKFPVDPEMERRAKLRSDYTFAVTRGDYALAAKFFEEMNK